jgi:hypothetical protein
LTKFKSVSGGRWDAGGDLNATKCDIYYLKYELKKLKLVSNENPVIEGSGCEVACHTRSQI